MNQYEIISKLGEGAFASVYKVKRKADSKLYALKRIKIQSLSEK
jgi:NIMA (never in mitosis gene a)-related kinase